MQNRLENIFTLQKVRVLLAHLLLKLYVSAGFRRRVVQHVGRLR